MQSQQKITFILPKYDNSKVKFPVKTIKDIESKILIISGGLTSYNCKGSWLSDSGKLYVDSNKIYFTVTDPSKIKEIVKILTLAKHILKQDSIYLDIQSVNNKFL